MQSDPDVIIFMDKYPVERELKKNPQLLAYGLWLVFAPCCCC